jgi:hypothetical protein
MRMFALAGLFAIGLSPVVPAAASHAAVIPNWEQCHIQTLRLGYNPYRQAYVRHMFHCLAGKTRK